MKSKQTRNNPTYVADQFCAERYAITRATWWRWVRQGTAPTPYRFTSQCTRWALAEIESWEAEKRGVAV